jgi:hypothetical protein
MGISKFAPPLKVEQSNGEMVIDVICRFLPNFGKYMRNVLDGKGNGEERDKAWGWKSGKEWEEARERARAKRREVRDLDADDEGGGGGGDVKTSPKL